MNYGISYKGSKSKIVKELFPLFLQRENFYDLFMGGGAMSHYALLSHKYQRVFSNDINWMCPEIFKNALEGKYNNETRWISHEDFEELKDKDPYVAFVWSFGNNLRDYIYGRDIEPIKKALHYVLFFQDDTYARELGYDLSEICSIPSEKRRYTALRHWLGGAKNGRTPTLRETTPNTRIQSYERLQRCKSNTIQGVRECSYSGGKIQLFNKSYDEIEIRPNSVIYCDIPYRNTNVYDTKNAFDYDKFYDWALNQKEPIFISEYWMPEDFKCIKEIKHSSLMCATENKSVIERVFVPKHQKEVHPRQLSLF